MKAVSILVVALLVGTSVSVTSTSSIQSRIRALESANGYQREFSQQSTLGGRNFTGGFQGGNGTAPAGNQTAGNSNGTSTGYCRGNGTCSTGNFSGNGSTTYQYQPTYTLVEDDGDEQLHQGEQVDARHPLPPPAINAQLRQLKIQNSINSTTNKTNQTYQAGTNTTKVGNLTNQT